MVQKILTCLLLVCSFCCLQAQSDSAAIKPGNYSAMPYKGYTKAQLTYKAEQTGAYGEGCLIGGSAATVGGSVIIAMGFRTKQLAKQNSLTGSARGAVIAGSVLLASALPLFIAGGIELNKSKSYRRAAKNALAAGDMQISISPTAFVLTF